MLDKIKKLLGLQKKSVSKSVLEVGPETRFRVAPSSSSHLGNKSREGYGKSRIPASTAHRADDGVDAFAVATSPALMGAESPSEASRPDPTPSSGHHYTPAHSYSDHGSSHNSYSSSDYGSSSSSYDSGSSGGGDY